MPVMAYLLASGASGRRLGDGSGSTGRLVARGAGVVPLLVRRLLAVAALVYSLFLAYQLFANAWPLPNGDVKLYHQYAVAFWETQPRLTRLPMEYPPLSVLPFGLTLLPDLPAHYDVVFAYWVGAFVVLGFLAFRRFAPWGAWAYVVYLLIGAVGTLLGRYDLFPAMLTLAALWAVERRRFVTAYVLLAACILLKLYPVVLVPVVVIAQWQAVRTSARTHPAADVAGTTSAGAGANHSPPPRDLGARRPRFSIATLPSRLVAVEHIAAGLAICGALVSLAFYMAQRASPQSAFSAISYARARPLQVESLPASVLWLGTAFGIPAHAVFSFQSYNYVGPLDGVVVPLSSVAMILGCLWIYWRQSRGLLRVGEAMLAILCMLLVTDKVFSPQYLIWVIPLVAAIEGFSTLWLAICALTALDYPILYYAFSATMHSYDTRLMAVLALRNGLLVYATLRAVLRPVSTRPRPAPPALARRPNPPPAWQHVATGEEPIAVRVQPPAVYATEPRPGVAGQGTPMSEASPAARRRRQHQQQKGIQRESDT